VSARPAPVPAPLRDAALWPARTTRTATRFAPRSGIAATLTRPLARPRVVRRLLPYAVPEGPRRWLNVAVAGVGLVVTLPLLLVIAVLIRLTSRGPVIYRQRRVGVDRRGPGPTGRGRRLVDYGVQPFTMYKFRTMVTRDGARQVWARPDDPRVTAVGRVLRKFRLDELPQLWNVLRGQMNLVGPRPEQPDIALQLRDQIDGYALRSRVRPGITGWAQVNLPYDRCLDDVRRKVALDLEYIRGQSTLQDLKIMLRTLPVMLGRHGGW